MPQNVQFTIPFEASVSPYLEQARIRHLVWVRDRELVHSDAGMHEYVSWDLPQAVARTYPYANADDQFMFMNWFSLAFLFDDQFDAAIPQRPDRVAEVAREMITVPFRPAGSAPDLVCPITLAWAEVWAWMSDGTSGTWQDRFAANWARFLAAHTAEVRLGAAGAVLDLDTYRALRRNTVGIPHSLDAIERSRRFEVPAQIQAHPLMRRLREAATDTIAYMNDIHSLEREERRGDPHNLVVVLRGRLDCSREAAIREAVRMTYEQLDTFMTLQAYMPRICKELALCDTESDAVEMSVEGMRNWIRGNYDWALSSGRYAAPVPGPDGRVHGYVDDLLSPRTGTGTRMS